MNALERFRTEKDDFYRTSPHSPLNADQKRSFHGLRYFPENTDVDLEVELEEFPIKQEIEMQTTTGDVQTYERFGRFRLTVDGQEAWMTVYRNESGYFLPFVDSQAGEQTYGAGRYLEPVELGGTRFRIDFNLAYNPYCAYNELWSCPITPAENRVKVPIRAGEMVFEEH